MEGFSQKMHIDCLWKVHKLQWFWSLKSVYADIDKR